MNWFDVVHFQVDIFLIIQIVNSRFMIFTCHATPHIKG